jgi:hypothetical protein
MYVCILLRPYFFSDLQHCEVLKTLKYCLMDKKIICQ